MMDVNDLEFYSSLRLERMLVDSSRGESRANAVYRDGTSSHSSAPAIYVGLKLEYANVVM